MYKILLLGIMLGMSPCKTIAQNIRKETFITSDLHFEGAYYLQKIPLSSSGKQQKLGAQLGRNR